MVGTRLHAVVVHGGGYLWDVFMVLVSLQLLLYKNCWFEVVVGVS